MVQGSSFEQFRIYSIWDHLHPDITFHIRMLYIKIGWNWPNKISQNVKGLQMDRNHQRMISAQVSKNRSCNCYGVYFLLFFLTLEFFLERWITLSYHSSVPLCKRINSSTLNEINNTLGNRSWPHKFWILRFAYTPWQLCWFPSASPWQMGRHIWRHLCCISWPTPWWIQKLGCDLYIYIYH